MELSTFAINDGYAEAILRGLRASFITEGQYNQMKSCSTKAELKSFLEETDYAPYIMQEQTDIEIPILKNKLKKKLAEEFEYIESQTVPPLSDFLFLMRQRYMIDNTVNMIEGSKKGVPIDILIANSDPLGYFPEMKNIKVLEGDDYSALYRDVLIDTPVGTYFMRFIEEYGEGKDLNEIQQMFKDIKPESIRTSLKKIWLEDFYYFCENQLNNISREMMLDLLKFEADCKSIEVVYNSLFNKEANINNNLTRKRLCPTLGYLYPDCRTPLLLCNSLEQLRDAVKGIENYKEMLKDVPEPSKEEEFQNAQKQLPDLIYEEECKRYELAFDQSGQYAVFYAYLKLKEQEIRNISWLAEMIVRKLPKNHIQWKKYIVPFTHMKG